MQRFFLPALLLAALAVAGCGNSNNNKQSNAPSVTPIAGDLVPRNATPSAVAIAQRTPTPSAGFSAISVATPGVATSPRPSAATTPAAVAAASPSATSAAGVTASPAATASAPAATPPQSAPTQAPAQASAPAAPAAPAPTTAAAATPGPSGGPSDPRALIDAVKPADSDLPSGFSPGQLSGYQANEQAINGFNNPQDVLALLNSTGRLDGYIEQVSGPSGSFVLSIQVWQDAAGAKTFFDQHPVPDSSVQFKQVQLDQPLGEQYQALLIGADTQASYALSWRVGRVVLGIGGAAGVDGKPSAAMLQLADLLTQRAQSAQQ